MLFNSQLFLFIFLPITLIGFGIATIFGRNWVVGWLALASLVFYAMWKPAFLVILAASILGNFFVSRMIAFDHERMRRLWLFVGVAINLGLLGCFKYLPAILDVFRGSASPSVHLPLPLGISFFTFTQIGYLIDLAQGEADIQDLLSYTLFVTFFPHLIAGPILHHKEIMPQFRHDREYRVSSIDVMIGTSYFVFGLFKKVVIADGIAPYASTVFADPGQQSALAAWFGAVIYVLELYFDFSGYSDMAIGLARMFSIRFPFNFDSPYKSSSVIEFWSRWHMTLTRYVTLYVYTPVSLAISRRRLAAGKKVSKKASRTLGGFTSMVAFPTIFAMLLAGIWHGAGLQFVVFGLIFGVCMTLEHLSSLFRSNRESKNLLSHSLSVLGVNLIVLLALIFFHSTSFSSAISLLKSMIGAHATDQSNLQQITLIPFPVLAAGGALLLVVWFAPNTQEILGEGAIDDDKHNPEITNLRWKPSFGWAILLGVALSLSLINLNNSSTFLYFQF